MVEHIVLLKLKEGVTPDQKQAILDGLNALKGTLPGIVSIAGGDNVSPEGKSHGFGWGFTITFEDIASRDVYLPHPDHKALSARTLRPIADDVLVFDYST
tara:strand:- start:54 stop:353 length:300 start_codon:yes stop_codon:yes gene_type:complete